MKMNGVLSLNAARKMLLHPIQLPIKGYPGKL
jgi:hypothetical protein